MAISAFLQPPELGTGSRRSTRHNLHLQAEGTRAEGDEIEVLIHNISESGMLIESVAPLAEGDPIMIELPLAGPVMAITIWSSGRLFGCRFEQPLSRGALSAAQLRGAVEGGMSANDDMEAGPDDEFGARLQRLRTAKGLSQAELAAALGVSTPSICGWERGRARPKPRRIAALADQLGVAFDELLGHSSPSDLQGVVRQSRERIARAACTDPEKVRIIIEI